MPPPDCVYGTPGGLDLCASTAAPWSLGCPGTRLQRPAAGELTIASEFPGTTATYAVLPRHFAFVDRTRNHARANDVPGRSCPGSATSPSASRSAAREVIPSLGNTLYR